MAWLKPNSSLEISATSAQWILLNINQTGYYRVLYQRSVWEPLIADFNLLPHLSRAQLLDDSFSLTLGGMISIEQLLQFATHLKYEINYFPWKTALRHFQNLLDKLYNHTSYTALQMFVLDQLSGVISDAGMSPKPMDSHTDKLKRVLVLEKACAFGHAGCLKKAVSYLESWKSGTFYDADLNMDLLCAALSNSSTGTWWEMWKKYNESEVPSVKVSILQALTCTKNVSVLTEFLDNITSVNITTLSPKMKNTFIKTLASTSFGAGELLNWLTEKLMSEAKSLTPPIVYTTPVTTTINDQFNQSSSKNVIPTSSQLEKLPENDIAAILSYITPKLTSSEQGIKLEQVIATLNTTGSYNNTIKLIQQATVQVYQQYNWTRLFNDKISTWLAESVTNPPVTELTTVPTVPISTTSKPSGAAAVYSSLVLCTVAVIVSL